MNVPPIVNKSIFRLHFGVVILNLGIAGSSSECCL